MPVKNPPHPGDFVRTEIIGPAGLSVTAKATLQVSRSALSSLLNSKVGLSGEIRLKRLELALTSDAKLSVGRQHHTGWRWNPTDGGLDRPVTVEYRSRNLDRDLVQTSEAGCQRSSEHHRWNVVDRDGR